eukprot:TRINITY_DN3784_c0_g2_i1.p1 TRINITY_DN3784_c0_g2~~TRINITY_DN3784_c0_g2_i1.p1  ORF type:complete len:177 (-),score=2.23 TRINITY_DN3784_c0_g2_i1:138-668(-)
MRVLLGWLLVLNLFLFCSGGCPKQAHVTQYERSNCTLKAQVLYQCWTAGEISTSSNTNSIYFLTTADCRTWHVADEYSNVTLKDPFSTQQTYHDFVSCVNQTTSCFTPCIAPPKTFSINQTISPFPMGICAFDAKRHISGKCFGPLNCPNSAPSSLPWNALLLSLLVTLLHLSAGF